MLTHSGVDRPFILNHKNNTRFLCTALPLGCWSPFFSSLPHHVSLQDSFIFSEMKAGIFFLFLVIRKGLKDAWITTILTNFSQSVNYRNPDIVRLIRKASQNYYQKVTCAIFWVFHFFHLFLILKVQVAYGGACNEEKRQICNGTGSKWVIGL